MNMLGFGKREAPPSIIERPTFAKEEWFQAFYEGNSLIPLANEGIDICVLSVALEEQNINWREFANSQFSPSQINRLGSRMSDQHRHKGVAISTKEKAGAFEIPTRIIDNERLEKLWETTTFSITAIILQYILDKNSVTKNREEVVTQIEKFFGNPRKNQIRIDQLRKALVAIKASLYESPSKELLAEYIEGFRTGTSLNRMKWSDVYLPKLKETLTANLAEAFDGNLPADIRNFINRLGWREPFD